MGMPSPERGAESGLCTRLRAQAGRVAGPVQGTKARDLDEAGISSGRSQEKPEGIPADNSAEEGTPRSTCDSPKPLPFPSWSLSHGS